MEKIIQSLLNERRICPFSTKKSRKFGELHWHITQAINSIQKPTDNIIIGIYEFVHRPDGGAQNFILVLRYGNTTHTYRIDYVPFCDDKNDILDGLMIQGITLMRKEN